MRQRGRLSGPQKRAARGEVLKIRAYASGRQRSCCTVFCGAPARDRSAGVENSGLREQATDLFPIVYVQAQ
eukprot:6384482-Lingulodinium_polyedra.AAC.1